MSTPDGIATEDWDVVHALTVDLVNAEEGEEQEVLRRRLLGYLDRLESRYGPRPSILATRADFILDDLPARVDLLTRAYALASDHSDLRNQLYIASSLADLYIDDLEDVQAAHHWLDRAKRHLDTAGSEVDRREYERVQAALERLQRRKSSM